jgi:transposase
MLKKEECMEVVTLRKQGHSLRDIAKMTGYSVNTIRKYGSDNTISTYKSRPKRPQKLEPFQEYIRERVGAAAPQWIPSPVIFREILALGYTGKIRQLRHFMSTLKPKTSIEKIIRFETEPGEQMQVDWAHFKEGKVKLYAFIATLGFSRKCFIKFVEQTNIEFLLQCHTEAFEYFEGVTKYILYDNMKTVVIERNAYGQGLHRLHSSLYDFAKHYGFIPKLCRPYRAQTKGKVERFIRYTRENFFAPLVATLRTAHLPLDAELANREVKQWLLEVANCRKHQTTGERPCDRWEREKQFLFSLPKSIYPFQQTAKELQEKITIPSSIPKITILQHDLSIYDELLQIGGV